MADAKKDKKDKKAGEPVPVTVSIAHHPRAKAGIRRARTRAAFAAFVVVFALNYVGSQDLFDATWRALVAGIVVNVIVWRCAIIVWRHVVIAELRAEEERRSEIMREHQERMEKLAAEQADAANPGFRAA
jgi:hypothetical protein